MAHGNVLRAGLGFKPSLLMSAAAILLRLTRVLVRASGRRLPVSFRHGFANLYRPGTHSASVLVALGVGVMFTLTTYLVQQTVLRGVKSEAPGRSGNVFLLDISPSQRDAVAQFFAGQRDIEEQPQLMGYFVARMLQKNGVATPDLPLSKQRRDQLQTSRISVTDSLPRNFEIVSAIFGASTIRLRKWLFLKMRVIDLGSLLAIVCNFVAAGRLLETKVMAVFRPTMRGSFRFDLLYPREAMKGIPAIYFGSAQVKPSHIPALEQALFEKFPTLTVVNLADVYSAFSKP